MTPPRHTTDLDATQRECLDLLIVFLCYRDTLNDHSALRTSRRDIFRWMVQLRTMENDMILRICRLDDDTDNHSLRRAAKSLKSIAPEPDLQAASAAMKDYRSLINPLKVQFRNHLIAHLNKNVTRTSWDPEGGLEQAISSAVNIVDLLSGRQVPYTLSVGSQERSIDLRAELGSHTAPES